MASIEKYKTDSGAPRWLVRYDVYVNGQREQKKKSFKTSKDANAFRSKVEHAINTGMYADARGLTVGEYLDMWVSTYTTNIRPNSLRGYQNVISNHIKPRIGNVHLEALTTAAVQKMYNDIRSTEYCPAKYETANGTQMLVRPAKLYSPKTVRNVHAVLNLALDQARKEGLIVRNAASDAKLPAARDKEYTIPEPEQLQALLAELQGAECYLAILTCALLACRRGEALGLYWSDINFKAGTVELKRALIVNNLTNTVEIGELKTKNARRVLPLPAVLRDALLDLKKERAQQAKAAGSHTVDSPFLFTTAVGKPFRPDSLSQAFKRAAAKVGLPGMRLHDLRHTGISYMLVSGVDPKTVSGFVGHATAQFTLNQYAHVMKRAKKEAGATLENAVFAPAK